MLRDFLSKAEQQYDDLTNKYKLAQEQFNQCVEYFGETPRSQAPTVFFTIFVKFLKAFNQAKFENEQRVKIEIEAANAAAAHQQTNGVSNGERNGRARGDAATNDVIRELKKRNPTGQQGVNGNGALGGSRTRSQVKKEINIEDLIEGRFRRCFGVIFEILVRKYLLFFVEINRGYVTADAERRKRQRTQEIKKEFIKTSPIQIIWLFYFESFWFTSVFFEPLPVHTAVKLHM